MNDAERLSQYIAHVWRTEGKEAARREMDRLSHSQLYRLRDMASPDMQSTLGPAEHQAFAREWTEENPLVAVPSLGVAIPLYTMAKRFGLLRARTPGTMDEMLSGFRGIAQGMGYGR